MLLSAAGLPVLAAGSSLLVRPGSALAAPAKKSSSYGPAGPKPSGGGATFGGPAQPLAERVLQKTRHAFTVAAAKPKGSFAKGGMAAAAAKFMKTQSPVRISRASTRAMSRLSGGSQWKAAFGPYDRVAAAEYAKSQSPGEKYGVPLEAMVAKRPKIKKAKIKRKKTNPDDYKAKPIYERIEFHLNRVECVEDTNEVDADEIFLGGHLIRPDGSITKIGKHLVGDEFSAGVVRHYDDSVCIGKTAAERKLIEDVGACNGTKSDPWAGRVLASVPLAGPWPGTYGLVLLMVEQDQGGMNDLLTELYQRIKDELADAIEDLGEATGDAVAEYLGEDIGEIINEIVVWVLTELVAWIVSLFDNVDDPIAGKSWVVTLPNRTREAIDDVARGGVASPPGTRASKIETLRFAGDGGKYDAEVHWRALS